MHDYSVAQSFAANVVAMYATAPCKLMLRPFHNNENQCAAERRVKAERFRDAHSKAGFLGQLRHLNMVQQQLQSMCPASAEPSSSQAGLDLTGERWAPCPRTAPADHFRGQGHGYSTSSLARRRHRPVHTFAGLTEDDPQCILFSEEPEDPRVCLPAHRIGDVLPDSCVAGQSKPPKRQDPKKRKSKLSQSAPTLHITAKSFSLKPTTRLKNDMSGPIVVRQRPGWRKDLNVRKDSVLDVSVFSECSSQEEVYFDGDDSPD